MTTTDNLSERILIFDPDLHFIDLTLELAAKGEGQVEPNPMGGAVVVKNGVIVGRGFHRYDGVKHAEVLALEEAGQNPVEFLSRHQHGDWGTVPEEDKKENEFSILNDLRILSAYLLNTGTKIWIITEADRVRPFGWHNTVGRSPPRSVR